MKEIIMKIQLFENEFLEKQEKVRQLVVQPYFNPFPILELCNEMNTLISKVLLLREIIEQKEECEFDRAFPGFN